MGRFDHLKDRDIANKTAWLALPQVTDNARLLLRPATDANPGYQNGLLRFAASRLRRTASSRMAAKVDIDESREDDRKLYPEFVIAGWEGIEDSDGNLVPFSREAAAEFCEQLPAWLFDRVRLYAMVPENFLPPNWPKPDKEALVGNSGSGSSGS